MKKLNLYFPQWQGGDIKNRENYIRGSKALLDKIPNDVTFEQIKIDEKTDDTVKNMINRYDTILENLCQCKKIIDSKQPNKIFLFGGDCGTELLPVSYLNNLYERDLLILWFDAHGDLNSPLESPSGNFHGMPLRTLLGNGDKEIIEQLYSKIKPEQISFVGVRGLDNSERKIIVDNNINLINSDELDKFKSLIEKSNNKNIYLHIDLDVINPKDFSHVGCPTGDGLSLENLKEMVNMIPKEKIVGLSILEPALKDNEKNNFDKIEFLIDFAINF